MIRLVKEPDGDEPLERCCFCRVTTPYWTSIKGRKLNKQVACCEACAKSHKVAEVPTKADWCKKEGELCPSW